MQRRYLGWMPTLALLIGLTACSSPERRIRQDPAYFNSLPTATQELIREGKVGIGFDEKMVLLAVGEPNRRWMRTDADGSSLIWAYTTFEGDDGVPLFTGWYHRGYSDLYPYAGTYRAKHSRDYFKVTFKDGKVTSIEQDVR